MNLIADKNENKGSGKYFILARLLVSLLILFFLVSVANPEKIKQSLIGFNYSLIPVIFGLIVFSMLISALKWKILLDAQQNRISFIHLFRIYITSLFFNNFLPSSIGGDGVRIYLAGKHCGSIPSAAASVAVERTIATVSLSLLGLAGILLAVKPLTIAVWPLVIVLITGITAALVLLKGWIPVVIEKREGRLRDSWVSFSVSAGCLKSKPGALFVNLLLSVAFQINVALVVASIIWGMGLPVPASADMFYITSASSVLAMIPAGINGYGLREGAYIMLLQPYGFSSSSALTVSILFALFVSMFSLAGGIDWIISIQRNNIDLEQNEVTV